MGFSYLELKKYFRAHKGEIRVFVSERRKSTEPFFFYRGKRKTIVNSDSLSFLDFKPKYQTLTSTLTY